MRERAWEAKTCFPGSLLLQKTGEISLLEKESFVRNYRWSPIAWGIWLFPLQFSTDGSAGADCLYLPSRQCWFLWQILRQRDNCRVPSIITWRFLMEMALTLASYLGPAWCRFLSPGKLRQHEWNRGIVTELHLACWDEVWWPQIVPVNRGKSVRFYKCSGVL